jgi:hypothetical protein
VPVAPVTRTDGESGAKSGVLREEGEIEGDKGFITRFLSF